MLNRIPIELIFWVLALVLLRNLDFSAAHLSLCPLAQLGLDWCPGCGIGRSIALLLNGNVAQSFKMHWFGIPALVILLLRIVHLAQNSLNRNRIYYSNT